MRTLILFCLISIPGLTAGAVDERQAFEYQQGYDPAAENPNGIREIAEGAWGDAVKGLQAAVDAPPQIRLNEPVAIHLVVRNVSDKVIRVTFESHPDELYLKADGDPNRYAVSVRRRGFVRWEIAPGHRIDIPSRPFRVLAEGDIGPRDALHGIGPGEYQFIVRAGAGGERWMSGEGNEPGFRLEYASGEWQGMLKPRTRDIRVLADKVPFTITAPPQLKAGHGLQPVFDRPDMIDSNATKYRLGDEANLYLERDGDAHWIYQYATYNKSVFWGPLSGQQVAEFGLLDVIKAIARRDLENPEQTSDSRWLMDLVTRSKPFAELALDLSLELKIPAEAERKLGSYTGLTRLIRDHRLAFRTFGLEEKAEAALAHLIVGEPPLPDEDEFKVVADKSLPENLPAEAWGPQIDGLRAAALMPQAIADGETVEVPLFIRNVSERPIYLSVSNRKGYDYPAVIDTAPGDEPIDISRAIIYPTAWSSVIRPEVNPGSSRQHPPTATLTKLKLLPGAIWKLRTKTAFAYRDPASPLPDDVIPEINLEFTPGDPEPGKPAVSMIVAEPTEALVTWHLHTANGWEYSEDLQRRIWPAKGGWSGLLQTAPMKVQLRAK